MIKLKIDIRKNKLLFLVKLIEYFGGFSDKIS